MNQRLNADDVMCSIVIGTLCVVLIVACSPTFVLYGIAWLIAKVVNVLRPTVAKRAIVHVEDKS